MARIDNSRLKLAITLSVTVLFIALVEYFVGFGKILASWQTVPVSSVFLAIILIFFSYALRALRIYSFLGLDNIRQYGLCFKTTLLHNFLNNVLPMRSGELSLPVLLRKYFGTTPRDAVVALLFFRALDFHVIGLTLLGTGAYLYPQQGVAIGLLIFLWCLLLFAAARFRVSAEVWLNGKSDHYFYRTLRNFITSFPASRIKLFKAYWWTLANWVVKLLVLNWIFLFFYQMDAITAFVGVIGGEASSVLPIHGVAGAGTYEAGIVIGAGLLGEDAREIFSAAVNLHLFVLGVSAVAAMVGLVMPDNTVPCDSVVIEVKE